MTPPSSSPHPAITTTSSSIRMHQNNTFPTRSWPLPATGNSSTRQNNPAPFASSSSVNLPPSAIRTSTTAPSTAGSNTGKKIEIINVSLTAVNSYTVLGFAREVVKQEPDAVLIYTGHNEFYGALGVASTSRLGSTPWLINTLLWLRQWRLFQLLTRIFHALTRSEEH